MYAHHRSYQSVLPTHNKLLQKRWDETYFQEHRRRVKTAGSMVSTNAPREHPHVVNKLKKQQREAERMEVVQRDNTTLMLHMQDIMKKGSHVDHRNTYDHWSLNYNKRANELQRIQTENIKMLGRIQSRAPNYCASEWVRDRTEKERLLRMITTHPSHQPPSSDGGASLKKEKKTHSLPSLIPLATENDSNLDTEVSVTDTIISLEKDLEIASNNLPQNITKNDIDEVRSFKNPPILVCMVLEAYAILLEPTKQPSVKTALPSLTIRHIFNFDKHNIPYSVLEKLQPYVFNPEINPDKLRSVSFCVASIWQWIQSIYQYGVVAYKLKQLGVNVKPQDTTQPLTSDEASVGKKKKPPSPTVQAKEDTFKLDIEVSATDTISSLERDLEIANKNIPPVPDRDLTELKSLSNPPVLVKLVFDAYVILSDPTKEPSFKAARHSLATKHYSTVNKDDIPYSALKKLHPYISNPEINPDKLRSVSASVVALWQWVQCIYQYGVVAYKLKQLGVNVKPQDTTQSDEASVGKKKETPSPTHQAKENSFKLATEVSASDTISSLERDLEIANKNIPLVPDKDLSELKSLSKPPVLVGLVLIAYGILLDPTKEPSFKAARQSLGSSHGCTVNKDNIPYSALKKLHPYISNQEINPDKLRSVSLSVVTLWQWIQSIYQYGVVAYKLKQLNAKPQDTTF